MCKCHQKLDIIRSFENKTEEECEKECINIIKQHICVRSDGELFCNYIGYNGAGDALVRELYDKETIDIVTRLAKEHNWKEAYELGKRASKFYADRFERFLKAVD